MNIKEIWENFSRRFGLKSSRFDVFGDVDEFGLLRPSSTQDEDGNQNQISEPALARKTVERSPSIERLQDGFNRLIGQLEGINENLAQQAHQQQELIEKISQLPRIVEAFPSAIANQQRMIEHLSQQIDAAAAGNKQFIEAIKKIPDEAMRQTDALHSINRQISSLSDSDMIMNENFSKFNIALDKLSSAASGQTDGLIQMSQTFESSDRYLKHLISQQNKRLAWIFFTAIGVCMFVILALIIVIIFVKS